MLERFLLRQCLCSYKFASMKENQSKKKTEAGRIGGLAKVAKGFAKNPVSLAKAIRASAKTRKAASAKRRKLAELLAVGGTVCASDSERLRVGRESFGVGCRV